MKGKIFGTLSLCALLITLMSCERKLNRAVKVYTPVESKQVNAIVSEVQFVDVTIDAYKDMGIEDVRTDDLEKFNQYKRSLEELFLGLNCKNINLVVLEEERNWPMEKAYSLTEARASCPSNYDIKVKVITELTGLLPLVVSGLYYHENFKAEIYVNGHYVEYYRNEVSEFVSDTIKENIEKYFSGWFFTDNDGKITKVPVNPTGLDVAARKFDTQI